jgi:hypothetical protein
MPDASNPVDQKLLLSQYEASLKQGGLLAARLPLAAAGGFLFLTLASIFLFYFLPVLPLTVLWAVPMLFPIVFGALVLLAAQQAEAAGRAQRLAQALPDSATEPPAFPTPWRINGALGVLTAAPFAIFAGLYLVVLYYCGREIYPFSHLMGLGFALLYLALTVMVAAAFIALRRGLAGQTAPSPAALLTTLGRWILPFPRRPFDGRIFWVGFLVPLLAGGLNGSRWAIVNLLFRDRKDWNTNPAVPLLAVAALGLLVYLAFEVLLHQAAVIWSAERNGARDGMRPVPYPVAQIIGRWLLALLLAALIDARGLLTLALIVTVYHILNIRPLRGGTTAGLGRLPVLKLLVEALGLPLRFAAGVMVWGNPSWDFSAYAFMGVAVYFVGLGLTAGRWQREGRTIQAQDSSFSSYFAERGAYWRKVGLWAAFFSGVVLTVMQTLSESCSIRPGSTFASFYAACPYKTITLIYTRLDKFSSLFIAFDMLLLLLIISMLLVWGLQGPIARLTAAARPFHPLLQPAYLLVGLAVAFATLVNFHSLAWAAFGVNVAIVGLTLQDS